MVGQRRGFGGCANFAGESRALVKSEMEKLMQCLVCQASPEERKWIKEIIRNEQYHHQPLQHGKPLLERLWELGQAVRQKKLVKSRCKKNTGEAVSRLLQYEEKRVDEVGKNEKILGGAEETVKRK